MNAELKRNKRKLTKANSQLLKSTNNNVQM